MSSFLKEKPTRRRGELPGLKETRRCFWLYGDFCRPRADKVVFEAAVDKANKLSSISETEMILAAN